MGLNTTNRMAAIKRSNTDLIIKSRRLDAKMS